MRFQTSVVSGASIFTAFTSVPSLNSGGVYYGASMAHWPFHVSKPYCDYCVVCWTRCHGLFLHRLRCGREWLMMANPWCFIAWSWNPGLRIMSRRMGDVMRTVVRIPRGRMVRCQHKSRSLRGGIGMYFPCQGIGWTKKNYLASAKRRSLFQKYLNHFSQFVCFFLVQIVVEPWLFCGCKNFSKKNPQVLSGFWVALQPWSSSKHC